MLPSQIGVYLALLSGVACSLVLFAVFRRKDGLIKLPTNAEADLPLDGNLLSTVSDPYDVSHPNDFHDGTPIDEDEFWVKTRRTKLVLSVLLGALLLTEICPLALSATRIKAAEIANFAPRVVFVLYLLSITLRSLKHAEVPAHSEYIFHLASLTALAVVVLGCDALLSSSTETLTPSLTNTIDTKIVLRALPSLELSLFTLVFVISCNVPRGPRLYLPPNQVYSEKTVAAITNSSKKNVSALTAATVWNLLFFSYTTEVVDHVAHASSFEVGDLPIIPAYYRAVTGFTNMKRMANTSPCLGPWTARPGSGWKLAKRLWVVNFMPLTVVIILSAITGVSWFGPPFFMQKLISYLESDPERQNRERGWVYAVGLFGAGMLSQIVSAQLWSVMSNDLQVRIRNQLNSTLFAKTLVRKDAASTAASESGDGKSTDTSDESKQKESGEEFSSKAQIMTLMTADVDRIGELPLRLYALIDLPIEFLTGSVLLYGLLGSSGFVGLAVSCLLLPVNHFAGKVTVKVQENLMSARDERVALMNEILGGIRMLKFMAWERKFEAKVLKIRDKELKYQRLNYLIQVGLSAIWNAAPVIVSVTALFHYTVVRGMVLSPSIAFTSIAVLNTLRFALTGIPEAIISLLQVVVSLRRIEKYLDGAEVQAVPPIEMQSQTIALQSATVTWPRSRVKTSVPPSADSTQAQRFALVDISLRFPAGKLSLICGKLGSGKTLLLLSLLGEADVLAGQVLCPRSPPDTLASFVGKLASSDDWIVEGVCAYVPQAAWLRNASVKDNILFDLPYDEERYRQTLEACALVTDLNILEDGDESEIGERGVNLSGGQKARVSLARAVYSRASILLLDDILSAVDAHTAHHLYHECLKGNLMAGRTIILVSHHVQLCSPGAGYIVTLDNGRLVFEGDYESFQRSLVANSLVQIEISEERELVAPEDDLASEASKDTLINVKVATQSKAGERLANKTPRKLVEDEKRAVGRVSNDVWRLYVGALGGPWFCIAFVFVFGAASMSPVIENAWLKIWSTAAVEEDFDGTKYYILVYAFILLISLPINTLRWYALYSGGLHASDLLYKKLLERVLFANIRFHDTVSRGRLLNRFGKDFEGIDSSLSDNFGRTMVYALSATVSVVTMGIVGGIPFVLAFVALSLVYFNVAKGYSQASRDMRRIDSVTRSPLYTMYGETISGVVVLRAFGASTKFLRDMLQCLDTNSNPYYWMWGVNRWLSARFNFLSSLIVGVTGMITVIFPSIGASLAGFALALTLSIPGDLLFMVRRLVSLEQSMVALERVKEYSELPGEPPEFVEPRPAASWPESGAVQCENLVIRYAPGLPNVLHGVSFQINPGEKIGILGRTGSGKSTLALSFFRFVEATEGKIVIDGVDISKIGLTDLRSKLTIIPQDPMILSGTLRSTLDVFDEYEDSKIFEALRRVHLIPSSEDEETKAVNANVFRDLESPVSEAGENFSTGEKQLLCMARAILKRPKVLVMDEATASVDYATDELISQTIRREFGNSTILTIAHRLRTVIDYDRVMILEDGRLMEFKKPSELLKDANSKFYALCKATGAVEFAALKRLANIT